jgi:nucleoside 2-deoxyribosyltransferase
MTSETGLWVAKKPSLYVGCALTDAPAGFRNEVENLKENLGQDWHVLKFLGLVDGTASDVYRKDIGNVEQCEAFLAICDFPSTGLGMEIGRATELGKSTLLTAHAGSKVTRMVLGVAELAPSFAFEPYETMAELPEMVRNHFAHVLNNEPSSE